MIYQRPIGFSTSDTSCIIQHTGPMALDNSSNGKTRDSLTCMTQQNQC